MGFLVDWGNEDRTVILQQYTGIFDKIDLYGLAEKSAHMLNSVSHTVHIIIDERKVKINLNAADIEYLEKYVSINQGAVVMIVSEMGRAYKKFIEDRGKKLGPKAFREPYYAATLEEAKQLLKEWFAVHCP